MTHTDTQQAIKDIMDSFGENIEYDQLINKLVDKDIITRDEVVRINTLEEKHKVEELLIVLLGKDQALHPLVLKILETLKNPSAETTRRADQAIQQAAAGSLAVRSSERRILSNSDVSQNWKLKNFLFDLSKEIDGSEFQDMKDLMLGESGFRTSAIEKIDRPMQFFQQMMNTGKLNAYNLHFLQALVRRIGRRDLNDKVRQFCLESNKKPIHFFTPSDTPENGYKYVKHHIEGDLEKFSHLDKERLRAEVANILCVPLTFVFIAGIAPSDSILITFMVPEEDVHSFIDIYVKEGSSSLQLSIHVHIQDNELSLAEAPPSATASSKSIFPQLKHLLEREQSLQDQLADRDERLVDLQTQLDSKEETTVEQYLPGDGTDADNQNGLYKVLFHRMIDLMKTMQPRECKNGSTGIGSLKLSSASTLYKMLLGKAMKQCSIDPDLLNRLLDARVVIENTIREDTLKKMHDIIQMLTQKVEELTEMNGLLRMSGSITGGSSSFLQDILTVQTHTRNMAIDQKREEQQGLEINGLIGLQVVHRLFPVSVIDLREEDQKLLSKITLEDLSQKDRGKLKTFLCFSDAEKTELERHPNKLLELAILREIRSGRQEPVEHLLKETLAKIKKGHLSCKYFPNIQEPTPKIVARRSVERKHQRNTSRSETPQRRENEGTSH